jgi:hypothetical protein
MKKYCYFETNFPTEAFLVTIFVMADDYLQGVITLPKIYTDPKIAGDDIQLHIETANLETLRVPEDAVVTYLKFERLYPLQRKFWRKPTIHYTQWERIKLFSPVVLNPQFYKVLVVPTFIDSSKQTLEAVLPFIGEEEKTIKNFMLNSDQVVDQSAKFAAIYTCTKAMHFNWKTGDITEVIPSKGIN